MAWLLIAAWGAALLVALVVLGFCAYELTWKAARLRRDLARLEAMNDQVADLRSRLASAQQRAAALGSR